MERAGSFEIDPPDRAERLIRQGTIEYVLGRLDELQQARRERWILWRSRTTGKVLRMQQEEVTV